MDQTKYISKAMPFGEADVGLILSNLMPSQVRNLLVEWSMNSGISAEPGSEGNVSLTLQPADDH